MWSKRLQARVMMLFLGLCLLIATQGRELAGTDSETGLKVDTGWELVKAHCSGCHSLDLVTQNRMSPAAWINTIRWMQQKQGLWDLGAAETRITAYLAKHYGVPERPLRRKPLNISPLDP